MKRRPQAINQKTQAQPLRLAVRVLSPGTGFRVWPWGSLQTVQKVLLRGAKEDGIAIETRKTSDCGIEVRRVA